MRSLASVLFCLLYLCSLAQEQSPFKEFGKVTLAQLQTKNYSIDTNASAVVLMDKGIASIEGNSKGWFSLVVKRHKLVHILDRNGFHEVDVEIPLFDDGDNEERLKNLKAVTYNLENGRIKTSRLGKNEVYRENINKNLSIRKFTMPDIREGSIIEIQYEVVSDFISNLDPWYFQGSSPVLWSEFVLSLPQFFSYGFVKYGFRDFDINEKKDRTGSFMVVDENNISNAGRYHFTASITDFRWVMKNLHELKEENFTSTLKNHIARIEFQLASHNSPLAPKTFRTTWPMLTASLMESEQFGNMMEVNNNWLAEEVKNASGNAVDEEQKARLIFQYIRDNYYCNGQTGLWRNQSLKNLVKTKKGSVAEINLLLVAMMRYAGLECYPVILSTTSNGIVPEAYPMVASFNYVICQLKTTSALYYLDASKQVLGFGKLLPECYNGHARVVNEDAGSINLSPDSLQETKITALFISTSGTQPWKAAMKQSPGYFESYRIRNQVINSGKETYFRNISNQYGMDVDINKPGIDSLTNYELPVHLHYEMELRPAMEELVYINPMFGEGYRSNPFRKGERYYPVEMPYTIDETFILTMDVPGGYEVEELPQSLVAKFNEQENIFFEYRAGISGNTISLMWRIRIGRTVFMPSEYETLRQFFEIIVNKQNERIVFKRKIEPR